MEFHVSTEGSQVTPYPHTALCIFAASCCCSLSHVLLSATPWTADARLPCPSLSLRVCSNSYPSSLWCHPTISSSIAPFSFCPLSIFPNIRVFSNEVTLCIRWPKYWSFSFSINPSNECSGLISFRMDWFYLHAVQRTLKSLFQQHSLKASILWGSSFFYGPILTSVHGYWKTIAFTIWIFVSKVMSLLFNPLSRFVIAFLPRSKHLLIWWLQCPSIVILEPKKIKFVTVSFFTPSICHEVMGLDAMIFVF